MSFTTSQGVNQAMASIFESDSDDDKKRQQPKRRGERNVGARGRGNRPIPQVTRDTDLTPSYGLTFNAAAASSRNDEQYLSALRAPQQDLPSSFDGLGFASSIEEARRRREEEREDAIIRNLAKQREADLGDAELVEKDLSVGVFVTPQYKEQLQRRIKARGDANLGAVVTTLLARNGKPKKYDDDSDDDEPLQSHIFSFSGLADPSKEGGNIDGHSKEANVVDTRVPYDEGNAINIKVESSEKHSAVVELVRTGDGGAEESRRKRRETRKGMCIDETMVAAARLRFLDREKKRQLDHLHFLSLS